MKSKEVDPRIKALTGEVAEGKTARHIEDMINTALGFGRDLATIAEVKLMSRALREMRNAAIHSIVVYFAAWWLLAPAFGVEGLWVAMIIYVIARAAALGRYYPRLNKLISG